MCMLYVFCFGLSHVYHEQNMFAQTFQICVDISYIFHLFTVDTCSMFKLIICKCHEYHQWISLMDITSGMVLEKLRLEGELERVAWLESGQHQNGVTRQDGVTSPTRRAFQFRLQQCQNRLKSFKKPQ